MILGDLGADVIKIEPPGGSTSRHLGPFLDDVEGAERSLQYFAYNRNKRSIVLDPARAEDQRLLEDLIRGADFLLESSPPGTLSSYGLDFEALCRLNPTIVHVVVSPFGVDGPAADRIANDLTLSALGGQVGLQGSPDRAPVRVSIPQAWRHASAQAAAAAMIAHGRMQVTGEPQFVDVSAQCSVTWTMMNAMDAHPVQGFEFQSLEVERLEGDRYRASIEYLTPEGDKRSHVKEAFLVRGVVLPTEETALVAALSQVQDHSDRLSLSGYSAR